MYSFATTYAIELLLLVAEHCQQLKSLDIALIMVKSPDRYMAHVFLIYTTSLTKLCLSCTSLTSLNLMSSRMTVDLEPLVQHLPKLVYLNLSWCEIKSILPLSLLEGRLLFPNLLTGLGLQILSLSEAKNVDPEEFLSVLTKCKRLTTLVCL